MRWYSSVSLIALRSTGGERRRAKRAASHFFLLRKAASRLMPLAARLILALVRKMAESAQADHPRVQTRTCLGTLPSYLLHPHDVKHWFQRRIAFNLPRIVCVESDLRNPLLELHFLPPQRVVRGDGG